MKVILTCVSGFIVSHLVEHLIKQTKIKKILIIDNLKDGSKKISNHL